MANFIKAAKVSEVKPGDAKVVELDGKTYALFNVDGTIYCTDNTCVHRGGPLGEGFIDGMTVTCPWHGWQYDLSTGVNKMNPNVKIATFEVRIEGDDVLIGT